jgi:hypothetical protein
MYVYRWTVLCCLRNFVLCSCSLLCHHLPMLVWFWLDTLPSNLNPYFYHHSTIPPSTYPHTHFWLSSISPVSTITWSHLVSVLDDRNLICCDTRQKLNKSEKSWISFLSYERVFIRNISPSPFTFPFFSFPTFSVSSLFPSSYSTSITTILNVFMFNIKQWTDTSMCICLPSV